MVTARFLSGSAWEGEPVWGPLQSRYTIHVSLTESIAQWLQALADESRKDFSETVKCVVFEALHDNRVLHQIAPYFWREYRTRSYIWPGRPECRDLAELFAGCMAVQIGIALSKPEWFLLDDLAYSLCRTVNQSATGLIILAMNGCVAIPTAPQAARGGKAVEPYQSGRRGSS